MSIRNALHNLFNRNTVAQINELPTIDYTETEWRALVEERAYYIHLEHPDNTDEENWRRAEIIQKVLY
jgi:hypothetical protein